MGGAAIPYFVGAETTPSFEKTLHAAGASWNGVQEFATGSFISYMIEVLPWEFQ